VKNEPRVWVCLYDIHNPQYDQKTFRVILSFIRQNCVDGLLLGGDALDLSCVSHWNRDLPGNKLKGELSLTWTDSINISSNHSKRCYRVPARRSF
jgi:hypothetical protein